MEFICRQGTGSGGRAKNVLRFGRHQRGNVLKGLVSHDSIDYCKRSSQTPQLCEVPCKCRRIVAYVTDEFPSADREPFPSSAQAGPVGRMLQGMGIGLHSEQLESCEYRSHIVFLILSAQVHRPEIDAVLLLFAYHLICEVQSCSCVACTFFKHGVCLRVVPPDQGVGAFLEYSALFRGYLLAGAAQQGTMVQPYAGHNRELGINDIGAVKSTSKSRFDYCHIHFPLRKPAEGQSGCDFEKGQMPDVFHIGLKKGLHIVFPHHFPSARQDNLSPFAEIQQMRRGVEPDIQPCCGQAGCEH